MQNQVLQKSNNCATIDDNTAAALQMITGKQLIKFVRRIMALTDGRHEIIVTVNDGVQDWTVRPIGKVEK